MTTKSSSPFGSFGAFSPEAFSDFLPKADFVTAMARNAVETSSASARASAKGLQSASDKMAAYVKKQMNLSLEAEKKLSTTTSFQDAVTVQADYVKSSVENNLNNMAELSKVFTDTVVEASSVSPVAANQPKKTPAKAEKAA